MMNHAWRAVAAGVKAAECIGLLMVASVVMAQTAPAANPTTPSASSPATSSTTSASPAFVESMRKQGNEARAGTPAELHDYTVQQNRRWGELITRLKIKAE